MERARPAKEARNIKRGRFCIPGNAVGEEGHEYGNEVAVEELEAEQPDNDGRDESGHEHFFGGADELGDQLAAVQGVDGQQVQDRPPFPDHDEAGEDVKLGGDGRRREGADGQVPEGQVVRGHDRGDDVPGNPQADDAQQQGHHGARQNHEGPSSAGQLHAVATRQAAEEFQNDRLLAPAQPAAHQRVPHFMGQDGDEAGNDEQGRINEAFHTVDAESAAEDGQHHPEAGADVNRYPEQGEMNHAREVKGRFPFCQARRMCMHRFGVGAVQGIVLKGLHEAVSHHPVLRRAGRTGV